MRNETEGKLVKYEMVPKEIIDWLCEDCENCDCGKEEEKKE